MMNKYIFIDAETDGLYGDFISVAMIATDIQGNEIDSMYCGIKLEKMNIKNKWVLENVIPVLGEYDKVDSEDELLDMVWKFWSKYRDEACCVADVAYPVEMRLFEKCVLKNPEERMFQAPYPLLDLSSMLYARGIDPLIARDELNPDNSGDAHNAMNDVKQGIKIWKKYIMDGANNGL